LKGYDLPAQIEPIPPEDLPAYLKVWPHEDLPAYLRGWQQADLGAVIQAYQARDLGAIIGTHPWVDLGAKLRGYAYEVPADLPAIIGAVAYRDLPATVRATYYKDLGAYMYAIPPRDLGATLRGYQIGDLAANLIGEAWPYDLPASLNITGGYSDLLAYVGGVIGNQVYRNLGARVTSWYERNLPALINVVSPEDLPASIVVDGQTDDLRAFIYPKMVRVTNVISFITMSARDMSAVVNVCGGSMAVDLSATLAINRIRDLAASITGKKIITEYENLSATVGYANSYSVLDKLPLSITIGNTSYRVYDKVAFRVEVSRQSLGLLASIVGEYTSSDLSANVDAVELEPYGFENTKNRERLYFGLGSSSGEGLSYETIELSFTEMVSDYFYNSGTGAVYKIDPLERWVTTMESFIPEDKRLGIARRLHRSSVLHDIERFADIDEAVRFMIDYVTSYPQENLSASIASKGQFSTLGAQITGS
jgi:hypothetical protein